MSLPSERTTNKSQIVQWALIAIAIGFGFLLALNQHDAQNIQVIDGDTVWTQDYGKIRIRNIDAAELGTRCGEEAKDLAWVAMDDKRLEVMFTGETGYYGRAIGDVKLESGTWYSEYALEHPCVDAYE